MRARLALLGGLLPALALALVTGPAPTPAEAGPESPTTKVTVKAKPRTLVQGGAATLKVTTKNAAKGQRATLQRKTGGRWVKVLSRKLPASRKLDFAVIPSLGNTAYRVRLAKKGQTPGAVSAPVTVTVVPPSQSATLTLPTSALAGATVTAAAAFTPARAGRAVQLQQANGGTWTTVQSRSQDAGGRAAFTFEAAAQGTFQYRAVTVAAGGLAAYVSPVRTLVVTEPEAWTGETTLVTHDFDGGPANSYADYPTISDNGRYVAYQSNASDLVVDDPDNDYIDIFLWDRASDTNVLVSRSSTGGSVDRPAQSPVISGNGRFVFYSSKATNITGGANPHNATGVFRWDRVTGETIQLGGGHTEKGMVLEDVSESGNSVLVRSVSTTLTDDDYSGVPENNHLFKWTSSGGNTTGPFQLIDKTAAGKPGNHLVFDAAISDDGMAIAFTSWASNLDSSTPVVAGKRHAYLWQATSTPRITAVAAGPTTAASSDAYVTGISGDGALVGFLYDADDLGISTGGFLQAIAWRPSDVSTPYRLVSRNIGQTTPGATRSQDLKLSNAGLVGTFRSLAPLDNADTNGFDDLYSWHDGGLARIAMAHDGAQPNQHHGRSDLSRDGRTVAFQSNATNLTPVASQPAQIYVAGVGP